MWNAILRNVSTHTPDDIARLVLSYVAIWGAGLPQEQQRILLLSGWKHSKVDELARRGLLCPSYILYATWANDWTTWKNGTKILARIGNIEALLLERQRHNHETNYTGMTHGQIIYIRGIARINRWQDKTDRIRQRLKRLSDNGHYLAWHKTRRMYDSR